MSFLSVIITSCRKYESVICLDVHIVVNLFIVKFVILSIVHSIK